MPDLPSLNRRAACRGLAAALAMPATAALAARAAPPGDAAGEAGIAAALAAIEGRVGGRLGVAVLGGPPVARRADERFPLCSTFKALAAAAVLARVDAGRESLERALPYGPGDLLDYAPVARAALPPDGLGRMSVAEACAAALEWSDNTAGNLLLGALGGPEGLTAWLRAAGDPATRLDRTEPTLNTAVPGDPRDTTTPAAMAATLARALLGDALSPASRARLEGWMVAARTGARRLRAGLPPGWGVGDKTGTGDHGTSAVVAILRPPGRAPLIAAVYLTGGTAPAEARDAAHAAVGRLIAGGLG